MPVAHCDQVWSENQSCILWYCFRRWSPVQQVSVTAAYNVVNIYTVGLIRTYGIQIYYIYNMAIYI